MTNDLEIRHCRVLVAVSDHGGVSAAARALGLAQSTVSETFLSLERLIGTPVTLRRPGQEAELTVAALALLPHAHALIGASEAALAMVSSDHRNVIRLGAVESASTFLLPHALTAFRSHWPAMDVQIAVGLCDDLRKRVHRRELDAALTVDAPEGAQGREGSGSRMLSPARLSLFVSSRQTLGGIKIRRRDLARRPLLLPDPVGGELRIRRRQESRKAHCNGFPSHSGRVLQPMLKDSPRGFLVYDRRGSGALEIHCSSVGMRRAFGEGRSNSRRRYGPGIRAGWFRSAVPRKDATSGRMAPI